MSDYASKKQAADMAQAAHLRGYERSPQSRESDYSAWAGWILFAALMLMLTGAFHLIQGLAALFNDDYYLVGSSGLVVDVSYTAWGWVHLLAGAVALLTGVFLLSGRMWARVVGAVIAGVSAIVNIGFLAAYPIWSTLMIVLDIVIIMALTVHGGALRDRG
jgi:hypothetical protein